MKLREQELAAWPQVGRHFDQVLELDPPARDAWLRELAGTEPQLAAAVRSLLEEHEVLNAAGFLNAPLLANAAGLAEELRGIIEPSAEADQDADPSGLEAGAAVGAYRLLRKIGRGGMSSVWLAQSDGPVQREVALKLPLHGSGTHLGRFERERDLLAALTHPNIARLYDAGTAASGQSYLAMEYVAGTALLRNCDEHRLPVRTRLRLFLQVLEAVQFAHARLVIHRDLKPSNILVTAQGRVVLLDFGIGKLLTEGSAQTTQFGRALTPDYASPEQIAGQVLGTASDIYSLGVVLYELLAGTRPYRLKRDSLGALEDAILTEELTRPSRSALSAEATDARSTSVGALGRTLAGDLDTIVLKALKKNPSERYASVTALAQDINNYLQYLPVSARPDGHWYRIGRFVQRHKVPVIAANVAALALLSGTSIALWQAHAAAAQSDRATTLARRNESVSAFLGTVITQAAASPTPITVSELLKSAEQLAMADTTDSAENRAAVLEIIAERYFNLEDGEHAKRLMRSAVALLKDSADRALRSRYTCKLAMMTVNLENFSQNEKTMLAQIANDDLDAETTSSCLNDLAVISRIDSRAEQALRYARRGLDLLATVPGHSGLLEATLLNEVAFAHHLNGRNAEAQRYFDRALRKYTELGQQRNDSALNAMNNWAVAINRVAPRRALELYERVEGIERAREFGAQTDMTLFGNKGYTLMLLGRFEPAQAAYEIECRLADQYQQDYNKLHCVHGLAVLMLEWNRPVQAAHYLKQAIELVGSDAVPNIWPVLRATLEGRMALLEGRLSEARVQFDQVLGSEATDERRIPALLGKADAELSAANPAVAAANARQALRISTSLQGGLPYSRDTGLSWLTLGRALQSLGDGPRAREAFGSAVAHLSNTVDADHPRLREARQLLGS